MKSVIEVLRQERDYTIIFVIVGLPLSVISGMIFGDAVMWLGLVLVTLAVIYRLRIKCPYCGHPVLVKKHDGHIRSGYTSPVIWDYCPGCHADLTVPFDREVRRSVAGLTKQARKNS